MTKAEFAKTIDHAMLWQDTPRELLKKRCADVVKYGFACICCFPSDVPIAKEIIGDKGNICAVVGYPMGMNTTETKVFEALDAIDKGANEIDVVMNVSRFLNKEYDYVLNELKAVVNACKEKLPECIVKVIIEVYHLAPAEAMKGAKTMLPPEEFINKLHNNENLAKACELVIESGADYVKQATGYAPDPDFNNGTQNLIDIHNIVGDRIKVKNAGIPKDLEEAVYYVKELGVYRIGHNNMPEWLDEAGDEFWVDK